MSEKQIEVNSLGTEMFWQKRVGVKYEMFSAVLFCLPLTNAESILTSSFVLKMSKSIFFQQCKRCEVTLARDVNILVDRLLPTLHISNLKPSRHSPGVATFSLDFQVNNGKHFILLVSSLPHHHLLQNAC